MALTDRRADILARLVDEYIDTAVPVSSRALVDRHRLGLSTATIRNELAALEQDGYVTHPHTSAGRVPSDRGYRLYVQTLMTEEAVPQTERRTVEHQFHQASGGLDEWLSLAATVLAGWVGNAAIVTRPRARITRLKHVQLVQLHEDTALVVAVMDDGRVQQRILSLHGLLTQRELSASAERLNARLSGRDAEVARAVGQELTSANDRLAALIVAELIESHHATEGPYLDGVQVVLEQPEFASPERMLEAVRHLVAYELDRVVSVAADVEPGGTKVMIGSENSDPWLQEWSIVISSYGGRGGLAGTVAVLGPMRMHYARTIPRVRYLSALIDNLMRELVS
ncbi:MAG: heat-inducible transcription repressor HrcA [Dehalococcoidia bacterium]|nr:heat-inducible transcription repressor HrcA [Dehalococcoidia bacterium]